MNDFNLIGAARHYKASGKKLRPRNSYDAHQAQYCGLRSAKDRKRAYAAERNAHGGLVNNEYNPYVRYDRLVKRVSARQQAVVDRTLEKIWASGSINWNEHQIVNETWASSRPHLLKVVNAYIYAWQAQEAMESDRRMLANMY